MKVVAFLPAKGTSERIESKNMKLLNGKPLFLNTLEKLVECDFIDEVYLDSESDEILNYANYLEYIPLKRDIKLASNKTDGHQMFYNEVSQVEADIYIQILCTSPFISKDTIKTSGMYVYKADLIKQHNRRIGDRSFMVEVSEIEAIDIDEEIDFKIADAVFNYSLMSAGGGYSVKSRPLVDNVHIFERRCAA